MDVNIRVLLLERIQGLKEDIRKALSREAADMAGDMLNLNKRIYFYIFKSEA